jgi:arylsulfatase A-like enzyme
MQAVEGAASPRERAAPAAMRGARRKAAVAALIRLGCALCALRVVPPVLASTFPVHLLLLIASACTRERDEPGTGEVARLVVVAPDSAAMTYTLADETRPVLATPPETQLTIRIRPGLQDTFTFRLPDTVGPGDVIATGVYEHRNRVYRLSPAILDVAPDASGRRSATMPVPVQARGPGPKIAFTLVLTTPATPEVTIPTAAITVPPDAQLELAYALSEAAAIPGAASVQLEVVAREGTGERPLWSTALRPDTAEARRWQEATIPLAALAARHVTFLFRARASGTGQPVVFPLWADPTVTARVLRPRARRNVVLISIDTLRADRVGVYGSYRPTTPAIDALAAESVVFANAWAPWPETSGSHMSLFTSRYPSEHGVTSYLAAAPTSIELLAERLRREGYLTRAFTEDGGVWALAGFARGFAAYSERRSADFVHHGEAAATFADATSWLAAHTDRSFFLFVHTYQVHEPYDPPPAYRLLFSDIPGREPLQASALNYDRETRFTDDQIGRFLATLRRLGLAERTLVIITSDHGEEFGEHGGMGHGRTLHREVLQVPLILWAPGLLLPGRVTAPVSLLDVAPTILELLGLAADPGYRGTSLVAAARGRPTPADRPIFAELDRLRTDKNRFVSVRRSGRTAILDLHNGAIRCYGHDDPGEQHPETDCPDLAALIAEHQRRAVPARTQKAPVLDPRQVEKMRALGYLE